MPRTTAYKSHPANVRQVDAALYEAEVLVRQHARTLGVSVAYFYADNDLLAEAILAFGLLSEPERRQALRRHETRTPTVPQLPDIQIRLSWL